MNRYAAAPDRGRDGEKMEKMTLYGFIDESDLKSGGNGLGAVPIHKWPFGAVPSHKTAHPWMDAKEAIDQNKDAMRYTTSTFA